MDLTGRKRRERQRALRRAARERQRVVPWAAEGEYDPLGGAVIGAFVGALMGCLGLAVGAVRIVFALAAGESVSFDELQVILFYVGGFILAGTVVGSLWWLKRTLIGPYILGILGAGIFFLIMSRGIYGPFSQWDGAIWFGLLFCALVSGTMVGHRLVDEDSGT